MKTLLTLFFTINFFSANSQTVPACEIVKEFDSPYRPAAMVLFKENIKLDSIVPSRMISQFNYAKLEPGNYKIVFSAREQETTTIDRIVVSENEVLSLRIKMEGPACTTIQPIIFLSVHKSTPIKLFLLNTETNDQRIIGSKIFDISPLPNNR